MSRTDPVEEVPFWLELNGERVARLACSPGDYEALAVGWLLAAGYLEPGEPAPSIELFNADGRAPGARVRLPDTAARRGKAARERRVRAEAGALDAPKVPASAISSGALDGPGSPDTPAMHSAPRTPPVAIPGADEAAELFRRLYASAERYREGGGLHSAALWDGRSLRYATEEVGRHNAVDKVIGHAFLEGVDCAGWGLVLSARVSGEIAYKAVRARLGWIASRSVPTTLALETAAEAGLSILARAPSREPRLYRPGEEWVAS